MSMLPSVGGRLIPVKEKHCKVCLNNKSEEVVKLVNDGIISNRDAADRLEIGLSAWYNHLKFCVRNAMSSAIAPKVDDLSKKVIDNVFELIDAVDRTKSLTEKLHKVLDSTNASELDPKQLQSYVMLEKQLSHTIELYSKITGDLKDSAVINVRNTKIELNDFRTKVIGAVCMKCRKKLANMDDDGLIETDDEKIKNTKYQRDEEREVRKIIGKEDMDKSNPWYDNEDKIDVVNGEKIEEIREKGEVGVDINEVIKNGEDV